MGKIRHLLKTELGRGVSVRKLATKIGVSRTSIVDYIDGNTVPRLVTVAKIANYFRVRTESLIVEDGDIIDITPELKKLPAPDKGGQGEEMGDDTALSVKILNDRANEQGARIQSLSNAIISLNDEYNDLRAECTKVLEALGIYAKTGDRKVLERLGGEG